MRTKIGIRVGIGLFLGLSSSLDCLAAEGLKPEWSVLEKSDSGITLQLDAPRPTLYPGVEAGWSVLEVAGAQRSSVAGAPDLPFLTTKIAVPAGYHAEVRFLERSGGTLIRPVVPQPVLEPGLEPGPKTETGEGLPISSDRYERDEALFASAYPVSWAGVHRTGRLRFLQVATIAAYPYRWNPSAGGVDWAEQLTVRVDFVPDPVSARGAERRVAVPRDHGSWDAMLRNQILNGEDASRYRSRPALVPRPARRPAGGGGPEFRIEVLESGVYKVPYNSLPASTGPWPLHQVAVLEKGYDGAGSPRPELDIPSWIDDKNANGQFDSGDVVYFYGQNYPDRFSPEPRDARYGNEHAYWLTIRAEGGVRTEDQASHLGRSDLTPESSFVSHVRVAKNRLFRQFLLRAESHTVEDGTEAVLVDHSNWLGRWPTFDFPDEDQFDIPGYLSARRLSFEIHNFEVSPTTGFLTVRLGGTASTAVALPEIAQTNRTASVHEFDAADLAGIPFQESDCYIGVSIDVVERGAAIESMDLEYDRSYRAFQNRVTWNTDGLSGDREFFLEGFNNSSLVVFETTNPQLAVRLTYAASQTDNSGAGNGLRLQVNLDGTERRFEAVTEAGALTPHSIQLRDLADLWSTPEHEALVITASEFSATLEPYIADRRDQGWNLQVVEMRDIADLFDHGRRSPLAIRRYLRYLFASADVPPSYLLLVGGGSEDHRLSVPEETGENFIPVQTIPAEAEQSGDGYEITVSEHWFVDDLTGTGEFLDFFPDMHVGRFPVTNTEELTNILRKIKVYEQPGEDDAWRSRILLAADDEFSATLLASKSYRWRGRPPSGGESVFRYGARQARDIIHNSPGFETMQVDSFFLATYLDTVACTERCVIDVDAPLCADQTVKKTENEECAEFLTDAANLDAATHETVFVAKPELKRLKTSGYLIVSMQAHANAHQCTHESLWYRQTFNGEDQRDLENVDKPFIYMGFGCHMSEFADYRRERTGESLVEAMFFLPDGRGAIAGIASAGYEWLSANNEFQEAIAEAWFADPPSDEDGRARWVLGEMYTAAKFDLIGRLFGTGMVSSYNLLGDPMLTVEIGAPRLRAVKVNGLDWDGSERVEAKSGSDSLQIDVSLFDEVWIETVEVFGKDGLVPSSEYDLVWPANTADGDTLYREAVVRYETELDIPDVDYDIVIRGTDRNGLSREVSFPVLVGVTFESERDGMRQPLKAGEFVAGRDSVFARVTSPIDLSEGLSVRMNGTSLPTRSVRLDDDGREWSLAAELPASLGNEAFQVGAGLQNRQGEVVERSISVLPASSELGLVSLYNFPNPFQDETRVYYTLSGPAERATVRIFTLRGKEIRVLDGSARLGTNSVSWDGKDADGDPVANGVYYYKFEIEDPSGEKIERIEKIARIR